MPESLDYRINITISYNSQFSEYNFTVRHNDKKIIHKLYNQMKLTIRDLVIKSCPYYPTDRENPQCIFRLVL